MRVSELRDSSFLRGLMLAAVGVAVFAVSGCSGVVERGTEPAVMSDSPELAKEALDFGDWVLPADGKVLMVRREYPDDVKYNLVVETSPAGLAWMLDNSDYHAQFESGRPAHKEALAGPPLETSPSIKEAQDLFVSREGDSMIRDVFVDERSADLRIVHIEFRGQ